MCCQKKIILISTRHNIFEPIVNFYPYPLCLEHMIHIEDLLKYW
jgi:hypothetical protein